MSDQSKTLPNHENSKKSSSRGQSSNSDSSSSSEDKVSVFQDPNAEVIPTEFDESEILPKGVDPIASAK